MTLSPKFRLALIQSSLLNPSLEFELSLRGEPLFQAFPMMWHSIVSFGFQLRATELAELSAKDGIFFLVTKSGFSPKGRNSVSKTLGSLYSPSKNVPGKSNGRFLTLPTSLGIPSQLCRAKTKFVPMVLGVFQFLVRVLYLFVGVWWTVMNKMSTAKSFFASEVINGMIYAAGGNSGDLFELDSIKVLDPANGNWHSIASMGTNMASYDSAVLNGKLLVTEGWLWSFFGSPRGQVYDPRTNNWESMAVGLREGWTSSSVVVHGHLFVVSKSSRHNRNS